MKAKHGSQSQDNWFHSEELETYHPLKLCLIQTRGHRPGRYLRAVKGMRELEKREASEGEKRGLEESSTKRIGRRRKEDQDDHGCDDRN
jgi:hypothetical protein